MTTPTMQDLLSAGVHFGHQTRRGNPKMREYIYGARDGVHIINLEHSEKLLQEAADFATQLGSEGRVLLFVGTKKQAQGIVKEWAQSVGAPFLNYKWVGGLMTNFEEIRRNIKKLLELKSEQEKGTLSRYTKKEQLLISRKLEKFERELGGIADVDKLPDALFVIDSVNEKIAILEANRLGIPVIAITDSNSDPSQVTFPIPGNDDATKSIRIMTETIAKAYGEGIKAAGNRQQAAVEPEVKEKAAKVKAEEKAVEVEDAIAPEVAALEEVVEKKTVAEAQREV